MQAVKIMDIVKFTMVLAKMNFAESLFEVSKVCQVKTKY